MENDIEMLDGCMCEYVPENLRDQIDLVAETTESYPSQVVVIALQIGLAVILGRTHELLASTRLKKHGKIKNAKGKLSGKGTK